MLRLHVRIAVSVYIRISLIRVTLYSKLYIILILCKEGLTKCRLTKKTHRDTLWITRAEEEKERRVVFFFVWCNCMNIIRIQDVQSVVWLFSILMLPSPLRLRQPPTTRHQRHPLVYNTFFHILLFLIFLYSSISF